MRRFRGPELVVPPVVAGWADPEIHRLMALVQRVDVSGFEGDWRADGGGGVPYDPRLMLVTVWWCAQRQVRSPQQIAVWCRESVSLRVVWQRERVPSASAWRRFLGGHPLGWQRVAVSLLRVCDRAGLVDVSLTATDSTPMAAPAALGKTRTAPRITVQIDQAREELVQLRARITALGEGTDVDGFVEQGCGPLVRAEQLLLVRLDRLKEAERVARARAEESARRGRGIAGRIRTWQARVDKHAAELAAMIDRQNQAVAVYQQKVAAGTKPRGAAPRPADQHPHIITKTARLHHARARLAALTDNQPTTTTPSTTTPSTGDSARAGPRAQANTTDPASRILKGKNTVRWVLGRLLTLTVTTGQIILAALLSPAGNDSPGLLPNLTAAAANCHDAGITQPFGHHLADSGFACDTVFTTPPPAGGTTLVPIPTNQHTTGTVSPHHQPMTTLLNTTQGQALYARRAPTIEPVFAHLLRTDRHLHTRGHPSQTTEILALTTAYNAHKYLHPKKPPTPTST